MKGAKETTLFDVDATGALLKQSPQNDGVLNTIGMLGMTSEAVAFDILSDGNGGNSAWLMADGALYTVNLQSGRGTEAAKIAGVSGKVRDISILPKM